MLGASRVVGAKGGGLKRVEDPKGRGPKGAGWKGVEARRVGAPRVGRARRVGGAKGPESNVRTLKKSGPEGWGARRVGSLKGGGPTGLGPKRWV